MAARAPYTAFTTPQLPSVSSVDGSFACFWMLGHGPNLVVGMTHTGNIIHEYLHIYCVLALRGIHDMMQRRTPLPRLEYTQNFSPTWKDSSCAGPGPIHP